MYFLNDEWIFIFQYYKSAKPWWYFQHQTEASWTFLWLWYQTLVLSMVKCCWFPPKFSKEGWLEPSGSLGKFTSLLLEDIFEAAGAIRLVVLLWYIVLSGDLNPRPMDWDCCDWGWFGSCFCWECWDWTDWGWWWLRFEPPLCWPPWFFEDKIRLAIWIHLKKKLEMLEKRLVRFDFGWK